MRHGYKGPRERGSGPMDLGPGRRPFVITTACRALQLMMPCFHCNHHRQTSPSKAPLSSHLQHRVKEFNQTLSARHSNLPLKLERPTLKPRQQRWNNLLHLHLSNLASHCFPGLRQALSIARPPLINLQPSFRSEGVHLPPNPIASLIPMGHIPREPGTVLQAVQHPPTDAPMAAPSSPAVCANRRLQSQRLLLTASK
jgi:hypothetical protein